MREFINMKNTPQLIILILSIAILSKSIKIDQVTKEDEYFTLGLQNKHLVVGFYNSTEEFSEGLIDHIFEAFLDDPVFQENKFKFVKASYQDMATIIRHYQVEGHVGLFYYVENQLQEFREIGKLANEFSEGKITRNMFLEKSHGYLVTKHARIGRVLTDLDDFNNELENFKIIGVYFGAESSKNEEKYNNLAHKNIHFHFFKIKNQQLAKTIYLQTAKERYDGNEYFAIIRHKSLLTQFDPKEFVAISSDFSKERLQIFLKYESKAKLRDDKEGGDVVMDVYHKESKLILHTYTPSTPHSDIEAFEEAVQRLPKAMFYVSVNTHAQWIGHYHQIFYLAEFKTDEIEDKNLSTEEKLKKENEKKLQADKIYFIYSSKGVVKISEIETDFDADSIEDAIRLIYNNNISVFSKPEKEQFENLMTLAQFNDEL